MCINQVLQHQTPQATDRTFQPSDEVLMWREKVLENRICEWVGPYKVITFDAMARIVLVQKDENALYERYNITLLNDTPEEEDTRRR